VLIRNDPILAVESRGDVMLAELFPQSPTSEAHPVKSISYAIPPLPNISMRMCDDYRSPSLREYIITEDVTLD
jgi:hypothetical protein